jgi:hypothetical protein
MASWRLTASAGVAAVLFAMTFGLMHGWSWLASTAALAFVVLAYGLYLPIVAHIVRATNDGKTRPISSPTVSVAAASLGLLPLTALCGPLVRPWIVVVLLAAPVLAMATPLRLSYIARRGLLDCWRQS